MSIDYEKGFKDGMYQVYKQFQERVWGQPLGLPAVIKLTYRERNDMFNIIMDYEANAEDDADDIDDSDPIEIELDEHYFDYGLY